MTKLLDLVDQLKHRRTFGFMDDFDWYISPHRWTSVVPHGSVGVDAAGASGLLNIVSSGGSPALNDEAYVGSTNAVFTFATDKPLVFEAAVKYSDADLNSANVIVGLMDTVAAGALANGSGGVKSSYYGMVFYTPGGSGVWKCQTMVDGTMVDTPTTVPAGGGVTQVLTGQWQPVSPGKAEARFFIDGVLVAKHLVSYSTATAMKLMAGIKTGSAFSQTLHVDYLAGYQLR